MSILSKLLDPIFGSDTDFEDQKAQEYLDKTVGAFDGVSAPDLRNPDLYQYEDLGSYDPSLITAESIADPERVAPREVATERGQYFEQGDTAMGDISVDPRLQNKQYDSLSALDDIIAGGGLTSADEANLNEIQTDAAQADRGRREAILQSMASKGQSGGGMELLAQLQSSQAATDRQNQGGLDIAGMAQQRALDAIMQSGNMAGGMRDQQFGEDASVAQARDAINQFNTGNKLAVSQAGAVQANQMAGQGADRALQAATYNSGAAMDASKARAGLAMQAQTQNAGAVNAARAAGQANSQNVANANTDVRNTQAQGVQQTQQQNFDNKSGLAQNKAAAAQPGVSYYQGLGDRKTKKDAAYMDALIKGGTTVAKGM